MLLGIDVSTTGAKALLVSDAGEVVGSEVTPLELSTPRPLWSEQDPEDWWRGVTASIQGVLAKTSTPADAVRSVGLTGQMHGLTLIDEAGTPLRPAILWNDQRTASECDEIRARVGLERLIAITGNDALTGFTAPKILWVREHEPEVLARARWALLPKDFVRFRLSGEAATDKAGASGTLLFDIAARDFSPEVLEALEISPELLPPSYEGTAVTGVVCAAAAATTGLVAGTPIVGGGGDQAAQAVGVGATEPGVTALTLGTSGVVFTATREPFIEPRGRLHAFCHAVPSRWHLMGVMLSAAGSLRWYRDTFSPGMDYDRLLEPATAVDPGCEGLLFLPYLTGERTPHPDPLARGAFVGLTVRHERAHLTRAVLEGVAFGLRDGVELMKSAGAQPSTQIRISGGGARSGLWRSIMADTLNAELVTVGGDEGAAFGAALLAGVGVGVFSDVGEACAAGVELTGTTAPDAATHARYDEHYDRYRSLYPALREVSHQLGT